MAEFRPLDLPGLVECIPDRFDDDRGYFSETWSREAAAAGEIDRDWAQDNHSFSRYKNVLRGLHIQCSPMAQAKLVRVSRGSIYDVAVDTRRTSPTFGQWRGLVLSAARWNQLFIPEGFAHGFLTLEDGCEVQYKASAPYSPTHERSIRWDDPDLAIAWPLAGDPILSAKDRDAPSFASFEGDC